MSQEELARRLGLSKHTVDAFEQGTQRASAKVLFEIAEVLELMIEGFFSSADSFEPVAPNPSLPPEAQDIAGHYDALSQAHRSAIFAFLVSQGR